MAESYSITAVLQAKVDGLVNGFKQAQSSVENFVNKNEKTFESFKKVGAAATAGGVAVAGGLAFAVKKASDFESGMSSVAAISGATGKDLQALSDTARKWGASTSFSATDAAKGLEYMALAGWDTQQMMGGIGPVLHLAEAGALDLGRASDLVTDSMAGLGLGVSDLDGYLDKVAATSANANTDIDALMEAFVIAGGTFDRFNVPLEESSAFLGVLANRGFKASEAGTAVNAIMSRLTTTTGPAAEQLKEMGISAYDSEGNFRGMEAVMQDVKDSMDGMTDAEKANAMTKLAGLNHGKTFNAMLEGLGDEYQDLKGKIEDSDGALQRMRDTMKDNLGGDLENLSSAFEEIAISIGDVLLPHVRNMIEFIQSLADKFNSLDDKTIAVIAVIATLAAGFLLLVGPIFMLIGFIPSMLAGFTALSTVFGVLTGPVALAIAAIVAIGVALVVAYNKFEWFRDVVDAVWQAIVTAIMSAVDGIVAFVKDIATKISTYWNENGELIRSATENVWNAIKTVIETVMPIIEKVISVVWTAIQFLVVSIWENIKGVIQGALDIILGLVKTFAGLFTGDWSAMWDGIKQMFSGAVQFLWNAVQLMLWGRLLKGIAVFAGSFRGLASSMWGTIRALFTSAINAIRNFFTNGFNTMRNVASTTMGGIRTTISTIWNTIKTVFSTVINTIKTTVSTGFSNVVTAIRTKMTSAVTAVSTKMTEMVGKVTGSVSKFFSAGKDLIKGLIDGIKNMKDLALNAITGVVDGVVNKAKSLLGIKSPSRVFKAIGSDTIEGMEKGMSSRTQNLAAITEELMSTVKNVSSQLKKDEVKITQTANAEISKIEKRSKEDIAKIYRTLGKKKKQLTKNDNAKIKQIQQDTADKIAKIEKKASADSAKLLSNVQKDKLKDVKLFIENKKSLEEISLEDEAALWKTSINLFSQGSKERVEAQKNYNKAAKEAEKQRISDAEEFVRRQKDLGKMSLSDEIIYWDEMRKNTKSGSDENLAARKNHQAAVKELRSQVEAANKEFNDRLLAIDKEYADESKKLQDEVNKAYEDHMNKLLNFAGIFDEFKRSNEITGQDLIKNLESQVDALEEYGVVMGDLSGRIDDEGLIDELRNLGVKSLDQLQALNSLSDEELAKYVDLYQIRFKEAKQQTDKQMKPMMDEVDQKLIDLKKDTSKRLDEVNKEWQLKIKQIVKGVDKEFDSMHQVGIDAMQGLSSGMSSMRSALVSQAESIANSVKKAMEGAFDIHSPSRWMRDTIGKNMMLGWIDGMEAMRSKVVAVAGIASDWMKPDAPVLSGVNLPTVPQRSYQDKQHGSSNSKNIGNNGSGGDLNQYITINSPKPASPSDNARKIKQASRDLLTEWRG